MPTGRWTKAARLTLLVLACALLCMALLRVQEWWAWESLLGSISSGDGVAVRRSLAAHPRLATHRGCCGRTALHYAAKRVDNGDVATALLLFGANPNMRDAFGETPLHVASYTGSIGTAEALVDWGAELSATDTDGHMPLHDAASPEVVRLLIGHGASIDAVTKRGETPLYWAAFTGRVDVAAALLHAGASLTAQTCEGRTALHAAVQAGGKDVVAILLASGAPVNTQDSAGVTPLALAQGSQRAGVRALLLAAGAR